MRRILDDLRLLVFEWGIQRIMRRNLKTGRNAWEGLSEGEYRYACWLFKGTAIGRHLSEKP